MVGILQCSFSVIYERFALAQATIRSENLVWMHLSRLMVDFDGIFFKPSLPRSFFFSSFFLSFSFFSSSAFFNFSSSFAAFLASFLTALAAFLAVFRSGFNLLTTSLLLPLPPLPFFFFELLFPVPFFLSLFFPFLLAFFFAFFSSFLFSVSFVLFCLPFFFSLLAAFLAVSLSFWVFCPASLRSLTWPPASCGQYEAMPLIIISLVTRKLTCLLIQLVWGTSNPWIQILVSQNPLSSYKL